MRAAILTYHSHNISGTDYAANDHAALASDLRTLTRLGVRIVPLKRVAEAVGAGQIEDGGDRVVAITFDDGPSFDFADFTHREFGPQRGFLDILRDFRDEAGAAAQPDLHATSFVIASPEARRAMERAHDCGYTWLEDWLTDAWWSDAIDTGLMAIGNHSWDHVHPAVERVATASQERGDFARVDSYPDADQEIRRATAFINARVGGRCDVFAYPFGHVNDYLVREYFPHRGYEHGMVAACGTGGRGIAPGDSIWNLPRLVCGEHWNSPAGLTRFLEA